MDIRRTITASLQLVGGVLLALCLGSAAALAGDGTIKGVPVKPFRPVFDLYPEFLKVGSVGVQAGSSGTHYVDERTPYFPYDPVGLECQVRLKDLKWQWQPSQTFSTKIEVHKYDGQGNGTKVAEHIVSGYALIHAKSSVLHRWTWTPTETGRYTFTCTADSRYEVDETNEHNNVVGQRTFFVLHKGVPADAFKVRIVSPTPGYVYNSPAETVELNIDPVLPDWWAEHVYMDVLKWDPEKQNWVGMNPAAVWNNTWYGSMPLSERGWGYYMVRAYASNSTVVSVYDEPYSSWAEPVFFWVGKPKVDVAAAAKAHLPVPHDLHLKKGVPVRPLDHETSGQKTIKATTVPKLHVLLQGARIVGQKLALTIIPPAGAAGTMQVECIAGPCRGQRWSGTTTRLWTVPGQWLGHPGSYQLRVSVGELQDSMRFDLSPAATINPAAVGKQPPGAPPAAGGSSTFDPAKAGGVHLPR